MFFTRKYIDRYRYRLDTDVDIDITRQTTTAVGNVNLGTITDTEGFALQSWKKLGLM